MIAIIDYSTGNLRSVENLFKRIGVQYIITSDPKEICSASHVLLPGVGAAGSAMEKLQQRHLSDLIRSLTVPTMGICLGMQLLCSWSEEDNTECLNIFPNRVEKMQQREGIKIPHVGWNRIENLTSPLFNNIEQGSYVYFVHSFSADINHCTIATTLHDAPFSASLNNKNFYGCQFHPEKSGAIGEQIMQNFVLL
ncbi:MAG: imidazole glycerol phosphate synthase subunit HisH [Rikenellaceae bacterium]